MQRSVLVTGVVLLLASTGWAQLNDAQFRVPTKPEPFNEKSVIVAPPKAGTKPPDKPPPLWCGGLEFGLSGSDGNADVLKIRLGGNAKRQTEANIFSTDFVYGLSRQNNRTIENKALYNVRDEFLFRDSPWGWFVSGQIEYDEFRAFDFRVAAHTGSAYQLCKTDNLSIRTRLGAGFQREIGGPTNRWVPEGLAGGDLWWKLTDRQSFVASLDYYPDLGRPENYRVRTRAAYDILIDPELCMTLRLGVQDRYDSNPGPAKRNDVDYFATLLFRF
jgi:putative salt-induced outer membrane protein YdiY